MRGEVQWVHPTIEQQHSTTSPDKLSDWADTSQRWGVTDELLIIKTVQQGRKMTAHNRDTDMLRVQSAVDGLR